MNFVQRNIQTSTQKDRKAEIAMTWSSDVRDGLTESLLPFVVLLLVLVVAFGMLSRKIFPSQSSEDTALAEEGEGEDENAKEKKQKV